MLKFVNNYLLAVHTKIYFIHYCIFTVSFRIEASKTQPTHKQSHGSLSHTAPTLSGRTHIVLHENEKANLTVSFLFDGKYYFHLGSDDVSKSVCSHRTVHLNTPSIYVDNINANRLHAYQHTN